MEEVNEFMNTDSLKTIAGCVLALVLLVNTSRHIFKWGPRWFAGALALVFSVLVFLPQLNRISGLEDLLLLLLVLVNACLIYTSAFGIQNSMIASEEDGIELQSVENELSWRKKW